MKTTLLSLLLLIGFSETSSPQVLVTELVEGTCYCFSETTNPEELSDDCFQEKLNKVMSLFAQNEYDLLAKELESSGLDFSGIDSTDYDSAYEMGEQMMETLKPFFFERLIFECDPFFNMWDNFYNSGLFKEIIPYDSAYAIKYIPIQDELIENGLGSTQTYTKRGVLYLVLGENENAISDFQQALGIDNQNIDPIKFLGFLALESKNYKEAELFFDNGYKKTKADTFLFLKNYSKRKASEN